MLRGTVTNSFALEGRGTVLTLRVVKGWVEAGDTVRLDAGDRCLVATVRSVEWEDDAMVGSSYWELAILVEGIAPSEVPSGTPIS